MIPTIGFSEYVLPIIAGIIYYATPENAWAETFHPFLPRWAVPQDEAAVRHFYEGLPDGLALPWEVWLEPVLYWCLLALAIFWTSACLMVIVRRQWMEREKLLYPLVQVPLDMIRSIGKMRHLLGLSVKALSAPQGSGNSPEDRLPVLRPSSQYSLVACRPVIRINPGPEGPLRHTQPYARRRRRVEKAGQAANSNSGSGGALAGANAGGIAGSPTPSRQVRIEAGSVRAAMIRRRPPQAAHSLKSEENTRASRVAQRSRWPQDAALVEASAADGSAPGSAGTMRSRARARGARTPW